MRRRQNQILLLYILFLAFCSCSKNDEADILYFEIIDQDAEVDVSSEESNVSITFPETVINAENLVAGFLLSEGAMATVKGVTQVSGQTKNNFEVQFSYLVRSEDKSNLIEWKVTASNNTYTGNWGLGRFQQGAYANNKDYEWYLDQNNTGVHSYNNCGPASTTMAAKWSNSSFSKTPEDARAAYRPSGGWWYTSDIDKYLTDNSIPHHFVSLSSNASGTQLTLNSLLDAGNIAILCLDMYYIRAEVHQTEHIDKFYSANTLGWGHFILVKGYRIVDDQYYYEVYDPYCFSKVYTDGSLKGKNRFYRSGDIFTATSLWWNFAIVVTKSGTGKTIVTGLDPSTIPDKWGK